MVFRAVSWCQPNRTKFVDSPYTLQKRMFYADSPSELLAED